MTGIVLALALALTVLPPTGPPTWQVRGAFAEAGLVEDFDGVAVLGVRAWHDPAGDGNDRGRYDDLVVVYDAASDSVLGRYRFNADPSRRGFNRRRGKYYGSLESGLYWYVTGLHRRRVVALRQAPGRRGRVTLIRDDGRRETGHFGINFHPGGRRRTGSEACQTLPPADWRRFRPLVYSELRARDQDLLPYLLLDSPDALPLPTIHLHAIHPHLRGLVAEPDGTRVVVHPLSPAVTPGR